MNSLKRYAASALISLALAGAHNLSAAQQAQQQSVQQKDDNQSSKNNRASASGLGLNTTRYENDFSTLSSSLTFFNFGKSELWLVGGQEYNAATGRRDFDIGLKYLKGKNLLRGTLATSRDSKGKERLSAGVDWDVVLDSYKNADVSLLGDASSVYSRGRHTDFGIGTKLTFSKNHNAFFLYSNRGEKDKSSYRTGYMFYSDEKLGAVIVDYAKGGKPSATGFLGLPHQRIILSYDPNSHSISSNNILVFGNSPIPKYARAGLLANQFILTQRSVTDSDAAHFFQSPFFLDPKGKISDVLRVNFSYDTKQEELSSLLVYNALLVRTKDKDGIVFTQNINRANGKNYYGSGIGYKFGHVTPVLIIQGGDARRITFDINFSY